MALFNIMAHAGQPYEQKQEQHYPENGHCDEALRKYTLVFQDDKYGEGAMLLI